MRWLLILMSASLLVSACSVGNVQTSRSPAQQQTQSDEQMVGDCGEESVGWEGGYEPAKQQCFADAYQSCTPAKLTFFESTIDGNNSTVTYTILGLVNSQCIVERSTSAPTTSIDRCSDIQWVNSLGYPTFIVHESGCSRVTP